MIDWIFISSDCPILVKLVELLGLVCNKAYFINKYLIKVDLLKAN